MTKQPIWLILISSEPYTCPKAASGIDAALACGAFGQKVTVVFEGGGLNILCATHNAPNGERNLFKQVASFPLYEIDSVLAVTNDKDIQHRLAGQAPSDLVITAISHDELGRHCANATHILSF